MVRQIANEIYKGVHWILSVLPIGVIGLVYVFGIIILFLQWGIIKPNSTLPTINWDWLILISIFGSVFAYLTYCEGIPRLFRLLKTNSKISVRMIAVFVAFVVMAGLTCIGLIPAGVFAVSLAILTAVAYWLIEITLRKEKRDAKFQQGSP